MPNGYIFTAFASGSTSSAGATYTWDFGDGHTDTTTALTTSHIYADNKNYTVTLSVSGYPGSVQHAAVGRRRSSHH